MKKEIKPKRPENKDSSRYFFGIFGEIFAIIVLTFKGYIFLKRRYRNKITEIDLIFYKNKTIVFVEVKSRRDFFDYDKTVSFLQLEKIKKAGEFFINKKPSLQKYQRRYDLFFVKKNLSFKHIQNV